MAIVGIALIFSAVGREVFKIHREKDPIAEILSPFIADGFDFPVGNREGKGKYHSEYDGRVYHSWYIATYFAHRYSDQNRIHTGEDWNGTGGGNTDFNQPVRSIGKGIVTFAGECPSPWGNVVMIRHTYLCNGKLKSIQSVYAHLYEIMVQKNDHVERRALIGTIGQDQKKSFPSHLHFEIRKKSMDTLSPDYSLTAENQTIAWITEHYEAPSSFIRAHRALTAPFHEKAIIVVKKDDFRLHLFKKGKKISSFEVALSKKPIGEKRYEGDLKVPEGEYRIIQKRKGPFGNSPWWFEYLGVRWMKLNYPNAFDAKRGLDEKRISMKEYSAIKTAINEGRVPPQTTPLGNGIGIHGWSVSEWREDKPRNLTWGCVSMHNHDILALYDEVHLGTKVIILP